MTGARRKALLPYVKDLVAVLHRTNNYRSLGQQLRRLRDCEVLRDIDEQRWLGQQVIIAHENNVAYYRSVTPKEERSV